MEQFHLCLTELLDQDLTAYEYFQSLSPDVRSALLDQEITTFDELCTNATQLKRQSKEEF